MGLPVDSSHGTGRFDMSAQNATCWTASVCRTDASRHDAEHFNGFGADVIDGGDITCQVTRPDFNDADLAQVINLASRRGSGDCELRYLYLSGTSVSDVGGCKLVGCRKLTMLEIPSMPLSDEAIGTIAQCRRLEFLLLDERRLTAKQLARLRAALPNVKLNGQLRNARIR